MTGESRNSTIEYVEAQLKYLADDSAIPVYIASVGGGDTTIHEGNYVWQSVVIRNARIHQGAFELDREGFTLLSHSSAVGDFYDDGEIAAVYEHEVRALVKRATGATRVEVFDHTRRSSSVDIQKERKVREPASAVHNDYSEASGPRRLCDHFGKMSHEIEALLSRRFAIVNVWRSVRGAIYRSPMTMCDAQSVAAKDLIPVKRKAKDRIGEIQAPLFNLTHRWYYFPEMQMNEALLIKTFDSATDGRARFTIHAAFDDPNTPDDAPQRESIETRCFAFF